MTKLIGTVLTMGLAACLLASARAADAQDATAILDKAISALGGQEKLSKATAVSWKTRGTITFNGSDNQITGQSVVQGLDHSRREFEGDFGKAVTVLAGDKGWRVFGGNLMELDPNARADEHRRTYLDLVPITIVPLKSPGFKVEAIAETTVAGKPAAGIKATGPDGKEFNLYFDKESGLPVRLVAKVAGFQGDEFTQETTFSDYQEMAGIRKAMKVQSKRDGEKFLDQQISDFQVIETVDPKTFAEPR